MNLKCRESGPRWALFHGVDQEGLHIQLRIQADQPIKGFGVGKEYTVRTFDDDLKPAS